MRTWILLCVIAVAFASSAKAAELSPEARECFDWFSTLGFPDVKDAPWTEIWEGVDTGHPTDPPLTLRTHGFLLKETDTDFRILTPDLTETDCEKSLPKVSAVARLKNREELFFEMAGKKLEELHLSPSARRGRFRATLDPKAEMFFLSFACWRKGNIELAQEIFDAAARLPFQQYRDEGPIRERLTMRVELEREIGHAAIWDGVLRFGGTSLGELHRRSSEKLMPRIELLELFRKIVRLYPACAESRRARDTLAMLETMVAQDIAHIPLAPEQIAKLPGEKQVAEWIFRLRDQNGHQDSQPGGCDIFNTLRGEGDGSSPAHQLVRIGYPAVPQLIEALGDEHFSRSVSYGRDFFFSHNILRVSDCAHAILERIAGQEFPHSRSGEEWRAVDMASIRDNVEAWWKVARVAGEKQSLIDLLSSGKERPLALVLRMREKYPDAVTDALFQGARNAHQHGSAEDYMVLVGEIKSEAATAVLLEKLNGHDALGIRMEAAVQLMNRDHPAGLNAALDECLKSPATVMNDPHASGHTVFDLLIASGKADAMREVVKDWDERPIAGRLRVIMTIGWGMTPHVGEYVASELVVKPQDAEAKNLAIALLAHALEDTTVNTGDRGSLGDYTFRDPRVCDFALWELHNIQPDIYVFSPQASPEQRDAERIDAVNQWLRDNGDN